MAGRKVRFEIVAVWHDLTEGGLYANTHTDSIIDDEGDILEFMPLTEPKPTVEKSKKIP